ncbi:MAG: translocation/assembly module TamB domain-containing protein [Pseudomonadota bacterium]
MSRLKLVLFPLAAVAVVVLLLGWFLLHTEAGARWLVDTASRATDGAFGYDGLSGSLSGGLRVDGVLLRQPGLTVSAKSIALTLEPEWLSLTLVVLDGRAEDIVIDRIASEGAANDDAADIEAVLERLALPISLRFADLGLADLRLLESGEPVAGPLQVNVSAVWGEQLDIEAMTLDSVSLSAALEASLELMSPFETALRATARAEPALTGLDLPLTVSLASNGTLEALRLDANVLPWNLEITAELENLLDEPAWELQALAEEIRIPRGDAEELRLGDLQLRSRGVPAGYGFQLSAAVNYLEPFTLEANGEGSMSGVSFESVTVGHAAADLTLSGEYTFPADFSGAVELRRLNPQRWLKAWPQDQVVSGRFGLLADPDSLRVVDGRFGLSDAPVDLGFAATVDLARERVEARLNWQEAQWPPGAEAPRLNSAAGQAELSGSFDRWTGGASFRLGASGVHEGEFAIAARGNRTSAEIDILDGNVLGGSVAGSAELDWNAALSWRADLAVEKFATGALFPAWPGELTADLDTRGSVSPLAFSVAVNELRGELIQRPLSGGGRIVWLDERLQADDFRLQHGSSSLRLRGAPETAGGLEFELEVDELAHYDTRAAGDIRAAGRLSRTQDAWQVDLAAESGELRWNDLGVTGLRFGLQPSGESSEAGVSLTAGAALIAYGGFEFEEVEVAGSASAAEQRIEVSLKPLEHSLLLSLAGALDDWGDPLNSVWRGALETLELKTADGNEASLVSPAPFELSTAGVALRGFCLAGSSASELCASFSWAESGAIDLNASATRVPFNAVNAIADSGFVFEQRIDGKLHWTQAPDRVASGGADLSFSPGRIYSRSDSARDLSTGLGELAFSVQEGELLSGDLTLPLPGTGYVVGELALDDIAAGGESGMTGALNVQLRDLELLTVVLPDVRNADGELAVEFALDGTLAEPGLRGTGELSNGSFDYSPLGLNLDDVHLDASVNGLRQLDVKGRFRAGDGTGEIVTVGESGAADGFGLQIEIRGEELTVVDLPDVMAVANLNVDLDYRRDRLDVNGRIDIPSARILPANLANAPVRESADVVVVAGTLPGENGNEERARDLSVHGLLKLSLGDDVRVKLDVAEARLSGSADFEWSGDPLPVGNGRYDARGSVEAFGQVLDISEGAIRYTGLPADDPGLRIRATREIYGNSQIKRAGVLVSGSLKRPQIEAYTNPPTTEERALALLVTGNDFNVEEGVGSIDFGTYIAPRLFLSYGVGVFDRENVISARYDLNEGFGIRATSGAKESGFDLTYRIER